MKIARRMWSVVLVVPLFALFVMTTNGAKGQRLLRGPQAGDIYKEFSVTIGSGNSWRVTDPNATYFNGDSLSGNNPFDFLPNPVMSLNIDDLQGAVRAEAVIDLWGGHVGTTGKKVRFNGHNWISIPELQTTPTSGQCYTSQTNVVVDVPISDLTQGSNSFDGTNTGQTCYDFSWGQHGWYGMIVRVYYGSSKPHPTGAITFPASGGVLTENPTITATATSTSGIARVDFVAYYDGYDPDGDGVFQDWQCDYHRGASENTFDIHHHVGTVTGSPYQVNWNTQWVPDQAVGSVKIQARIKDNNGVWYVPPIADNLSLQRVGSSVKTYKPQNVPESFWVNSGATKASNVTIPSADNLANATAAILHVRTWNGINGEGIPAGNYTRINDTWDAPSYGENHFYSYDVMSFPQSTLHTGSNKIEFYCASAHHGIEIPWPGPAISVRYTGSYASPLPQTPTLAAPANNATGQSPLALLTWHHALTASSYRLQVASDSLFASVVYDDSTLTDTAKQVGPLANQTRFFWRVRSKSVVGAGSWSSLRSFSTFMASPSLLSPENDAVNLSVSPVLSWAGVALATGYHLQVSADPAFASGLVVNDSTLTDTTKSITGLTHGIKYYWRVRAKIGASGSAFSGSWDFTTLVAAPGAPAQIYPGSNATGVPLAFMFKWSRPANTASFRLQVSTDSTFAGNLIVNDSTLADTLRLVAGLANNTRYFWRVNAKNLGGTGVYSSVWPFTTLLATPAAPLLVYPANEAAGIPVSVTFRWNTVQGVSFYRFQLATDSSFAAGIIKNDSTLTDTVRVVVGLTQNTKYFWRVNSRNNGGQSLFSATWSFTSYMPLPGQIALASPAQGSVVGADSARLVWYQPQPPASRFWLEVAFDSGFVYSSIDSMVTDTASTFHGLATGQTYYWKVRGSNGGGWGTFSAVQSFSVLVNSISERMNGIPQEYTLRQNFPNPFNPSTRIEFGLPKESRVRLEVYNLLGERIALLVDDTRPAGYYRVQFDAGSLASGLYFYRLSTGETSFIKKMMLVK